MRGKSMSPILAKTDPLRPTIFDDHYRSRLLIDKPQLAGNLSSSLD
jgi:hypothetical protein